MNRTPLGTANLTMSEGQWKVEWKGATLCVVPTLNAATKALTQLGYVAALRRGNTNDRPSWMVDIFPRRKNV